MSKIRFIIDNHLDNTTLSADPTMDTNLPVTNTQDASKSKVARSVDNSNQIIRGTFAGNKIVSAIVLGRHNFVLNMQYRISLYNNSSLDTSYTNTGGTEATNDLFYISDEYDEIFYEGDSFDVIGDTSYIDTCVAGTDNIKPIQDIFEIVGDKTAIYTAGLKFNYTGDTNSAVDKTYEVVSSTFNTPNTEITVEEDAYGASFDGIIEPYASYIVDTGGSYLNTTTYAVTGGVDNTDPTNDIFYVAGDQSEIFNRTSYTTCTGDTNGDTNITYTIVSVYYNGAQTRTEITVEEDVTGHSFDGDLLPVYTIIPVDTNTLGTPNFDGTILPDFVEWESGILDVTESAAGSSLWEWGEFLWGIEEWGSDRETIEFSSPSNIVEWVPTVQSGIRGFKVELYATSGNIAYFELGRIIIGAYIQPTYNIGYGHSLSWEEATKQYRTDAGSLRSDITVPYRKFEFNIGTIKEEDRILLQHELRNVGKRKDLFISLFPEDSSSDKTTDYSGIVKMTKIPKFSEFTQNYYKSKYVMEEV